MSMTKSTKSRSRVQAQSSLAVSESTRKVPERDPEYTSFLMRRFSIWYHEGSSIDERPRPSTSDGAAQQLKIWGPQIHSWPRHHSLTSPPASPPPAPLP